MNTTSAAIVVGIIAILGIGLWGLVAKQRSPIVGAIAGLATLLCAGGAWYAWAESKSIAWTIGYGVVAVVCLGAAIRQFVAGTPR